ncbi:tetraspanin-8 [Striga asiatica]|uniref:Tetraspanin-8 n=1 Tax=Striga asiatica TaxID=4170 RepID=A0A5A7PZJ6_STRAF|nr:tetraspanin-8 [Striga asiatica]
MQTTYSDFREKCDGAFAFSSPKIETTFVVTNSVAGKVLSGRGYREYRLGDYSNWLQNRVNDHWGQVRSYLVDSNICQRLLQAGSTPVDDFYREHLSALQSGCCKPSNDCNFTYVSPTNWTRPQTPASSNPDCARWSNEPRVLCYGCDSCKAGLLDNIKTDWKRVSVINIVFLVFLIIVYSVGCCAFRNNREDNSAWKRYP